MGTHALGPTEIDRLLAPPGKACTLLILKLLYYLLTCSCMRDCPGKVVHVKPSTHKPYWLCGWL